MKIYELIESIEKYFNQEPRVIIADVIEELNDRKAIQLKIEPINKTIMSEYFGTSYQDCSLEKRETILKFVEWYNTQ